MNFKNMIKLVNLLNLVINEGYEVYDYTITDDNEIIILIERNDMIEEVCFTMKN